MMRSDRPTEAAFATRLTAMTFMLVVACVPPSDQGSGEQGGRGGASQQGGSAGASHQAGSHGGTVGGGSGSGTSVGGQSGAGGGSAAGSGGGSAGGTGGGAGSAGGAAGSGAEGGAGGLVGPSAEPDAMPEPSAPKLSTDVLPVVKMHCARAGCHDPVKKEHGMDLSTAESIHAAWVEKPTADHCKGNMRVVRVVPGEPGASFVVTLIEAQPGRCKDQERMPPAPLPVLEEDEVKIITDWIAAGAKND